MKTCCFTGHRKLPDWPFGMLTKVTCTAIYKLANEGYTNFIAGGAMGFDLFAEAAVIHIRDEFHVPITLSIYVPFRGQESSYPIDLQKHYRDLLTKADRVVTLSEHYYNGCYQARNRRMVDDSDCCIAYLEDYASGTGMTVRYAQSKGLPIIRITPDLFQDQQ